MKVYKIVINSKSLKSEQDHEAFNSALKNLLGKVEDYIALEDFPEDYDGSIVEKLTTYLYAKDDSILSGVLDIIFDFGVYESVEEITSEVVKDYKQFKGIDSNYDSNNILLRNFLREYLSANFVIDYVENNGKERFEKEVLEMFPQLFRMF
jgi:hypothetical protein